MNTAILEKFFLGVCQVSWEDNQVKLKSKIIDWRDEKDSNLDDITNKLTSIAEKYSLAESYSYNDSLISY